MIGRLYILGTRRANSLIPELEIRQMTGRCGRSYTESGEAILISDFDDAAYAERCLYGDPPSIRSRMGDLETVVFAFLPHIPECGASGYDYEKWSLRSLAFVQGTAPRWEDVREYLLASGAAVNLCNRLHTTPLGRLSTRYYYPVSRVRDIYEKMELVSLENGFSDAASISWMLAYERLRCPEEDVMADEYRVELSGAHLPPIPEEIADGYVYWCLFQNRRPAWCRTLIDARRKDLPRLLALCRELARERGISCENELLAWEACGTRRLPYEAALLCREFPDATNANILELFSLPLHNLKEAGDRWDRTERELSPSLRNYLYGQLPELHTDENA